MGRHSSKSDVSWTMHNVYETLNLVKEGTIVGETYEMSRIGQLLSCYVTKLLSHHIKLSPF